MDQNFPANKGFPFIETPLVEVALYQKNLLTKEQFRMNIC